MTDRLDLPRRYREPLEALLRQHVPDAEVWAYGSRVNGRSHDGSDLDLVLRSPTLEPLGYEYVELVEALEQSNIPILVQAHDWARLPESFHREIERDYVVVQEKHNAEGLEDGWHEVALGDIAEIFDGPHATPKKTDSGPVFLGISNLVNGRIELSTTQHLSEDDYLTWTRRITPLPGDIVFSYETRLGEAAAIPNGLQCCLGRRMGLLRPHTESVDPRFLLYAYLGPGFQETLRSRAVQGSTVDRILLSELGTFPIEIPRDVTEQRAIAHILGTLDDKIELNLRMNQTLEAMARAIFQDWFVDFGPVRAKLEGREPYLPPELWDLFPDRLVDSELGEVPEGWEVRALGDCYDLTMGQSPPGSTYNDHGEGLLFFQGSTDFGLRYPDNRRYCIAPRRIAQRDDTLVSVRAPVGAINMALEQCCIGRGVAALRHKSGSSPFTYYSVQSMRPAIQLYDQAGTVFGAITRKQFESLPVLSPPEQLVTEFEALVLPHEHRLRANFSESRALAAQRDALLPKLMAGEDIALDDFSGHGRS